MSKKQKVRGIKITVGDKTIGTFPVGEVPSERERMFAALSVTPMVCQKGQITEIKVDSLSYRFQATQTFAYHGMLDNQFVVTIPVSFETLRGLGFVKKLKKTKK